jgi:hypothetical protein
MAAGLRVGVNQNLYRNTGTWGTPVWDAITAAIDVELGLEMGMAEVKARLSFWKMNLPALGMAPINFGMLGDTSIADYQVLRNAQYTRSLLGLAVADDLITAPGTTYWKGEYYIGGFPLNQGLEAAETIAVTCALAYSTNTPVWIDVV